LFFGFKLHIIINDKVEILSFAITLGNITDCEPLKSDSFINAAFGKLLPRLFTKYYFF